MTRKRSPNYPAISLPDAVGRIQKIHEAEHQNPAEREVMAQHLGYNGLNGASLKVLSALIKYGLLEKADGGELRVSDRAIDILFPEGDQKQLAIEAAALSPTLFAELREKWPSRLPSDENLRAYLIRRQFARSAIDDVIQTFRETFGLITQESGEYDLASDRHRDKKEGQPTVHQDRMRAGMPQNAAPTPMRVSITSDGLEVMARLRDPKAVDKLIQILQANKVLLEPVYGAFDTGDDDWEDTDVDEDHGR